MTDPHYEVRNTTRAGVVLGSVFGVVLPVALCVVMVALPPPGALWFWAAVLLIGIVAPTCGELIPDVRRLRESQAWGEVRLRLDEEGVYFGDEEKFIPWSRVVAARLIEERGESSDSEPPPTWFRLLVEVTEPDEFGQDRWGYPRVSAAAVEQVLSRYAPEKVEVRRLPASF